MNTETLINIALIVVLVLWIGLRQLSWRPVEVARMWRLPVILAAVGVFMLSNELSQAGSHGLTGLDAGILAFELLVSLAVGAMMGRMAHFRSHGDELESRTGWMGMVLWVAFIGLRVIIDIWAGGAGAELASSTAAILILIGVNRAARTGVFALRLSRSSLTRSERPRNDEPRADGSTRAVSNTAVSDRTSATRIGQSGVKSR